MTTAKKTTAKKTTAKKTAAAKTPRSTPADALIQKASKVQRQVEDERKGIKIPATPALDAAAQPQPKAKPALELEADVTPSVVCRRRGTSYTCIRLSIGETFTHFITMEKLKLEKTHNRDFHEEWEEYSQYPVRRAAELYLATPHREVDPQARAHLESIVRDPTTVYNLEPNQQPQQEKDMATAAKKTTPAAKKAAPAAAKTAPAAKQPAKSASTAPAKAATKPTVAKAAPAPAKPAAKQAAKPAAKATPENNPGRRATDKPNGISSVVSGAKPTAKQAAAAPKAPPARATDDKQYKVADPNTARRGVTAEFQEEAIKLKTFTRQKLIDTMVAKGYEEPAARIKVADMVYFKVLVPA